MNVLKNTSIVLLVILTQVSCSNQDKKQSKEKATVKTEKSVKRISVIKIDSPKAGEMFTVGDKIPINISLKETEVNIDSLTIQAEGLKTTLQKGNLGFNWETSNLKTGYNQLRIFAYSEGNKIDSYTLKLRFKSDIIPEAYTCKIIKTYEHNKSDYTQGLFYDNGIMYEGTGQYGHSALKKIDFKSGKIIAQLDLPKQYFGEGITAFKDKIIQLTWKSNMGFVYDKNSFKLLTTLKYPTQGWGITTDGEKLIMSDGTQTVHFLNPEYFNPIGSIEVYDNNGPIKNINELEYINGLVYANIWQTEDIIAIDIKTGKVVKRINCSSIVPKGYENEQDNVLNGIAYDHENDHYFIAGKRWPSLFEVTFIKE